MAPPTGPLAGLKVIDLAIARAGPTCVRALSDLGADVIQLWHPRHGDLRGSDSHNLHRGKRSILVDLKRDAGPHLRAVLLDEAGGQRHRPGPRVPGRRGARRLDRG